MLLLSFKKPTLRKTLEFVALAAAVALLDWISLYLTQHGAHVATLWPAKGLVLAVCLIAARGRVLSFIGAAALGGIAGKMALGDLPQHAIAGSAVSTAGIALTYLCIARFVGHRPDLRDWRKLVVFLSVVCVVAMLVALGGAAFAQWARGADFRSGWAAWVLATTLSCVTLTPPLVLAATRYESENPLPHKNWKIAGAVLAAAILTVATFAQTKFPFGYVVPIGLLIIALAAEIEGVAWGLLVTTVIALVFTVGGHGPAALIVGTTGRHVLLVQFYLATITIGLLPAAAAITERRKLRDRLLAAVRTARESEERYRLLAENSRDIIVRASVEGELRYISPSCGAFGYSPEELLGKTAFDLVHPEDLERFRANTAELASNAVIASPRDREHRFRTKSGAWVWLQGNPAIVRDAEGRPREIVNAFRDVTERKAIERELIVARERAETAAAVKADFLANMSHELRTPLTSIIGFADLLHDRSDLNPQAQHFVSRIRSGGRSLLATINDILDFSKLERNQMTLAPEPTDIAREAGEIVELLEVQATSKDIRISVDSGINQATRIWIDPQRLRQLFLNLVGNAVKFTEKGSVTLRLRQTQNEAGTTCLRCEVEDTGSGIPADRIGTLFQRFSQIDSSVSRRYGGTGLGLAICKNIVEAMGGRVGASSEIGRGSIFWFEVPAPLVTKESKDDVPPRAKVVPTGRCKVLAVDDHEANRALIQAALFGLADVVHAASGEQAVALAADAPFDVILMDIHMPGMDGRMAARTIRTKGNPNERTPIIAFTADSEPGMAASLAAAGFDGTLTKPLAVADIRSCVTKATGSSKAGIRNVA